MKTTFRCGASVLPHVFGRKEFWLFMIFHGSVGYAFRTGRIPDANLDRSMWNISWADMGVISGITTFFEVFYTGQSYSRYCHQYDKIMKLLSHVCNFSFEATCHIHETSPQHVKLATRFFVCSVILFFREVQHHSPTEESEELSHDGLISDKELEWLEKYSVKQRSILMLHWSAKITRDGFGIFESSFEDPKRFPKNALVDCLANLSKARDLMQDIIDTVRLPLPFQYFHLLNMMITVNLTLWGYGMALTHSIFGPMVYFFAATIFMGMMELSSQLSDPFGTDVTDFPLDEWLKELTDRVHCVIEVDTGLNPPEGWGKALASTPRMQAENFGDSELEESELESELSMRAVGSSRTSSAASARNIIRRPA